MDISTLVEVLVTGSMVELDLAEIVAAEICILLTASFFLSIYKALIFG